MSQRVPLVDLGAQHAVLRPELERVFSAAIDSSRFILGDQVEGFERVAATYLGVRHAIGVSSGTDALSMALMALGVGAEDEVITTPFSFFATVGSILRVGARPRFVDVERASLNLDAGEIAGAVTARTRAIVPVHLYGSPSGIEAIRDVADRHGIPIVEDAAQAFGARGRSGAAGTFGTFGCFSFFPTKILGALGDAGLVVTDDAGLAARCRRLRQHGAERRGEHLEIGGNFRLDALQAAVLKVKLPHVDEWIRARRANGAAYDAALGGMAGFGLVARGDGWNGAIYTVRVKDGRRDAVARNLAEVGVETAVYYETPLHLQPVLRYRGLTHGALPESERAAAEVLSLPVYPELTATQREHVIETLCG